MVETVWVLGRIYGLLDQEVASAIERTLQSDTLSIQNEQEVFTNDGSQGRTRDFLRSAHWSPWYMGRLSVYPYVRQEGNAAKGFCAPVIPSRGTRVPYLRWHPE
jgi:hypothetical protein